jgi:hypothetical protein
MGSDNSSFEQLRGLARLSAPWPLITAIFTTTMVVIMTLKLRSKQPWSLSDPVPRIYNTVQFLTNNETFMKRVM